MADVAVIGAGLNGLATAWALDRAGVDVVVYEQFEPGHTRGSSHGRTRIFRLAYPEEAWVRFALDALDGWRELERESGEELLVLSGLLELYREGVQSSQEALEACGATYDLLTRAETEERFGVVPDRTADRDGAADRVAGRARRAGRGGRGRAVGASPARACRHRAAGGGDA